MAAGSCSGVSVMHSCQGLLCSPSGIGCMHALGVRGIQKKALGISLRLQCVNLDSVERTLVITRRPRERDIFAELLSIKSLLFSCLFYSILPSRIAGVAQSPEPQCCGTCDSASVSQHEAECQQLISRKTFFPI